MHYTLHLTNRCNLNCTYCYVNHESSQYMSADTARKVVDLAAKDSERTAGSIVSTGIVFFGGEPLLCKDVIKETIEYCRFKEKHCKSLFYFKITTNGMLLDEEFMELSQKENIFIALSHDGISIAHDKHRLDAGGKGSFQTLSQKIPMLLSQRPYAPAMMVVNPDTAEYFADSVFYLYEKGFRYIIVSLNYAASWTEENMEILKKQYELLSKFYYERTLLEDKFYLSPFEVKISSHVNKDSYCHERCELGKKQISVAPDGKLYPCVQFVGDSSFCIGSADSGIDKVRQDELYSLNEEEKESCRVCVIRKRCNHYCGCMNRQATGSISRVSPVQCHHERILIPIVDRLAEKLYKKRNAIFIHKHYNDMFPIISMIEDNSRNLY